MKSVNLAAFGGAITGLLIGAAGSFVATEYWFRATGLQLAAVALTASVAAFFSGCIVIWKRVDKTDDALGAFAVWAFLGLLFVTGLESMPAVNFIAGKIFAALCVIAAVTNRYLPHLPFELGILGLWVWWLAVITQERIDRLGRDLGKQIADLQNELKRHA